MPEHDRHEDARDPIRELLDRGLGGLGLLDEADDLRERRVAPDRGGLHLEGAFAVESPADDPVARGLLDRDRTRP